MIENMLDSFTVIDKINDGITVSDDKGHFEIFNSRMQEITGYSIEEANNTNDFSNLLHPSPEEHHDALSRINEIAEKNVYREMEIRIKTKDNKNKSLLISTSLIPYKNTNMFLSVWHDISDKRRAQADYKTILLTSLDGFWILDLNNNFIEVNEAYCQMIGYSREELLKMKLHEVNVKETEEEINQHLQKIIKIGHDRYETIHKSKSGKFINFEMSVNYNYETKLIFAFLRDITERKQMIESLSTSEIRFRRLFESAQDGILILDAVTGQIVEVNPYLANMLGFSREELIEKKLWEIGLFKDMDTSKGAFAELQQKEYIRYEYLPLETRNKVKIDVEFVSNTYIVENKKVIQCNIRDITKRKKIEIDLKKAHDELEEKVSLRTADLVKLNLQLNKEINERKEREKQIEARNILLKTLAKSASRKTYLATIVKLISGWTNCNCLGIRLLNANGEIPYEAYTGFSNEFLNSVKDISLNKSLCACVRVFTTKLLPIDVKAISKMGFVHFDNISQKKESCSMTNKLEFWDFCLKSGFKSMAIVPIRYKNDIIGVIHIADEEKERLEVKTLEFIELLTPLISDGINKFNLTDEINRSHELLEKIFSGSNFLIAYLDTQFNFIRVNEIYAKVDKHKPDFYPGKNYFDLYPDNENAALFRIIIDTGEPYSAFSKPFVYFDHSNRVTYWDWNLQPVKNTSGKVEGLILFLVDVSKRKMAEEELLITQKKLTDSKHLSDIGSLAATVAHELRNPLAAIQMASYNLKRKAQDPLLEKHLITIEKKVGESNQIINNLLFYSRIKFPKYEPVKLMPVLKECILVAKNSYKKEGIHIECKLKPLSKIIVEADPLQIKEVFANILNNAFEALPSSGGTIIIKGERSDYSVKVAIADNGPGIDENNLTNVFDAFFTTKAKGTGLGLTVCKQIINLHGGTIDVKSQKDTNTEVTITIPVKKEYYDDQKNTVD